MTDPVGGFVAPSFLPEIWGDLMRRALGLGPETRTPEQIEHDRAAYDAESLRIRADIESTHAALLASSTGLRRQILELHAPTFYHAADRHPRCDGCECQGWEAEQAEFPCTTYDMAAAATE